MSEHLYPFPDFQCYTDGPGKTGANKSDVFANSVGSLRSACSYYISAESPLASAMLAKPKQLCKHFSELHMLNIAWLSSVTFINVQWAMQSYIFGKLSANIKME